ncbi:hypothetical protein [Bdellovibrio sp. HCB288]|uniref:hypothetical protein n=1 Tax=Bdellovibrio sp. HCB288 TaxID=3394355 RepID=UPI0039B61749
MKSVSNKDVPSVSIFILTKSEKSYGFLSSGLLFGNAKWNNGDMSGYKSKIIIAICISISVGTIVYLISKNYHLFVSEVVSPTQGPSWNWCPLDVIEVRNLEEGSLTSEAKDLALLCDVAMDEKFSGHAAGMKFKPLLMARGKSASSSILEMAEDKDHFRVDGQVFKSRRLQAVLVRTKFKKP